jgi:hypothetical protein
MLLTQIPAETNPITMAIADLLDQYAEADRETLVKLADVLGVPMPTTPTEGPMNR